jgi:DNA polymerase-3 subunit epsilon
LLLAFGKHAGRPLDEVAGSDPDYLRWLLRQDFLPDFKALVAEALAAVGD